MKKKDLMVIGVILLAAALLMGARMLYRQNMTADVVIIQADGKEYARVPFSSPQQITVSGPNGEKNVVEISAEGVSMESANCPNQDCIRQGMVTRENLDYRPNQGLIICLPNRVSVELQLGVE